MLVSRGGPSQIKTKVFFDSLTWLGKHTAQVHGCVILDYGLNALFDKAANETDAE